MTEIYKITILLAIVQGIFQSILLMLSRKNQLSNKLLSIQLFAFAISMSRWYFHHTEYATLTYCMTYVNICLYPVFGPLIYLYIKSTTGSINKISSGDKYHFVPFILFSLYMIVRYHLVGEAQSAADIYEIAQDCIVGYPAFLFIFLVTSVFYIYFSFRNLYQFKKENAALLGVIEKRKLFWLTVFLSICLILCLIAVVSGILIVAGLGVTTPGRMVGLLGFMLFLISTFCVTYFSVRYPEIFHQEKLVQKKKPYESHNFDRNQQEKYKKRILTCVQERRPYLDDTLTLSDFAKQVGISAYKLSMTLNTCFNQNFYHFINSYRIEDVKKKLIDPAYKEHSVLSIALGTGFNSKAVFNKRFKEITGMTPSQFKKKYCPT